MDARDAIDEGINNIGLTRLAEIMGESVQTISNWRARGLVPGNRCAKFESATGVSRKRLRPNDWTDFWPELIEGRRTSPGCTCGAWEMAETDSVAAVVVVPEPVVVPPPDPVEPVSPPAAAFVMGGRRVDDHTRSGFGALDVNGEVLKAEIDAIARLTGDLPPSSEEE